MKHRPTLKPFTWFIFGLSISAIAHAGQILSTKLVNSSARHNECRPQIGVIRERTLDPAAQPELPARLHRILTYEWLELAKIRVGAGDSEGHASDRNGPHQPCADTST